MSQIYVFYVSENYTLYDAQGFANSSTWRNGHLASDLAGAGLRVLVAPGTGIAATSWMDSPQIQQYSQRVYYVDFSSVKVNELSLDPGRPWLATKSDFDSQVHSNSSIAISWIPGQSFTNTTTQALHLFYQDTRGNIRHYPSLNGVWNPSDIENVANLSGGTNLASTSLPDTGRSVFLYWLDNRGRLQSLMGEGIKDGSFGSVTGVSNVVQAQVPSGPLSAITLDNAVRIYYQDSTNVNAVVEVGGSPPSYSTFGTITNN